MFYQFGTADTKDNGEPIYTYIEPEAIKETLVCPNGERELTQYMKSLRFKDTGQRRSPKRGEFYLSGTNEDGVGEVWAAPNDLDRVYHIVVPDHSEYEVTVKQQTSVDFRSKNG